VIGVQRNCGDVENNGKCMIGVWKKKLSYIISYPT
jgi:hypothetical protein